MRRYVGFPLGSSSSSNRTSNVCLFRLGQSVELDWIGMDWNGLEQVGLDLIGLDWNGFIRLGYVGLD